MQLFWHDNSIININVDNYCNLLYDDKKLYICDHQSLIDKYVDTSNWELFGQNIDCGFDSNPEDLDDRTICQCHDATQRIYCYLHPREYNGYTYDELKFRYFLSFSRSQEQELNYFNVADDDNWDYYFYHTIWIHLLEKEYDSPMYYSSWKEYYNNLEYDVDFWNNIYDDNEIYDNQIDNVNVYDYLKSKKLLHYKNQKYSRRSY